MEIMQDMHSKKKEIKKDVRRDKRTFIENLATEAKYAAFC